MILEDGSLVSVAGFEELRLQGIFYPTSSKFSGLFQLLGLKN